EGPVRLPQLPDGLGVRTQRGALLHRDLRGGEGHAPARRADALQRPLRPEPVAWLPGRVQGGEAGVDAAGGRGDPLAGAALGRLFATNSGYSYDAIFVVADVLERAAKLDDPDAIVDAIQKTTYSAGLMQYGGPIHFNEIGDNPNAIPTMIQILRQRPVAVWPK